MNCPRCDQTLMSVRETRKHGGSILRRRECFNLHTWWTQEQTLESPPPDFVEQRRETRRQRQRTNA